MMDIDKIGRHIELNKKTLGINMCDTNIVYELRHKIHAELVDAHDKAIINAIIESAKIAGITDLYLLDKQFILDAIREKMERENPCKQKAAKR